MISMTNSAMHLDFEDDNPEYEFVDAPISEVKPNGNAVNSGDEMHKKSETSMAFNETMNLYNKSRAMLRTAISGGGK
jgi:flagellar basal-body rod protein FlgB